MITEGYVYRIIAPGSNSVYVGQSVDPISRFQRHKRRQDNPALANFLKKHPDAEIYFWPVLDMDAEEIADEKLCREMGFNLLNCIPCGSKPPNMRGIKLGPHSDEHREALRIAQNRPETRVKRSTSLTGLRRTSEQRAKMSVAQRTKSYRASVETRAKMSAAHLGRKRSEETRAKMRGRRHSPETKAKMRAAHLGRKHTAERCANMSKAMTGKPWSPARRAAHERKMES